MIAAEQDDMKEPAWAGHDADVVGKVVGVRLVQEHHEPGLGMPSGWWAQPTYLPGPELDGVTGGHTLYKAA